MPQSGSKQLNPDCSSSSLLPSPVYPCSPTPALLPSPVYPCSPRQSLPPALSIPAPHLDTAACVPPAPCLISQLLAVFLIALS
ncbi:unnamed protein product [Merluccius merluccius]